MQHDDYVNVSKFLGEKIYIAAPQTAREVLEWKLRIHALSHYDAERFMIAAARWLNRYTSFDFNAWLAQNVGISDPAEASAMIGSMVSVAHAVIAEAEMPQGYLDELETVLLRLREIEGKEPPKVDEETFDGLSPHIVETYGISARMEDTDLEAPWWVYQICSVIKRVRGRDMALAEEERKETDEYREAMAQFKGMIP